jgi:hypothetical protein
MGLLDWMSGTKKPAPNVAPKSIAEVGAAILAVNRPTAPFIVRDGRPEGVDFVAEWRIVDATWSEVFAKAGLAKALKVLMKFDPDSHEVRSVDREWSVEWRAGVPTLAVAASVSRGQTAEISFGTGYAFTEAGALGDVYRYKFESGELKKPLQAAVTGAGWTWKAVAFGKL